MNKQQKNYGSAIFILVSRPSTHCKLPFALRPGLPQDEMWAKEITKGKNPSESERQKETKESAARPLVLARRLHERERG